MALINLFLAFLKIGLFAIGGAYSFLPLIEKEVVEKYHWLTREEFLDVLGAIQVFPGAISIKYATYTGYKVGGIPGAILANLGNLFAPVVLVIFASMWYTRHKDAPSVRNAFNMIQLAVFAMIIAVAFKLFDVSQLIQPQNIFLIAIFFMFFLYTKTHPALIIISAGILGLILK
jgi:chromate transporter